jgi:uncharacterized repeat protein (TIGR03847 family)
VPRQVFLYDPPERFVAGTVGEPGRRTFYLQAAGKSGVTTVALEKAQVAALAERVDELLDDLVRRSSGQAPVPAVAPPELEDTAPLDMPVEEEFRVGTMALAWDADDERLVIEAQAVVPGEENPEQTLLGEDDEEEGPPLLRARLTGAMARAFAKRSLLLVSAGRPSCPFCGQPMDPEGHICPRANGYRR